jgi:DHA1 family multidrug resistance protein-like MFS transporter
MSEKLSGQHGPLGIFQQYPILLRLGIICVCAEIAWATLLAVLQYHFMDDLMHGQAKQLIASRIATAMLAFVACETLFKIPMGALADRYGPRPMIFFALTISAISPILMIFFAREWYHFVPLRGLDGLGAAALWPAMSALMALSVPREAKAAAMSVFNGAYCLGLAVGPMAGLYLGHHFGNTKIFPLCALLMLTGLFIAWRVLRPGVGDPPKAQAKPHMMGEDFPAKGSVLRGRPMLLKMMALYAVSQCAVGFVANTMVPYVDGQFGIKEGDLPRLILVPALFIAVLAIPLGRVGDSIGRPQAVWISYVMATVGMFMVAATSLLAPTHNLISPQIALFGAGMLLLVGSYILGTPAWLGLTSVQVGDSQQAQALSLMQTSQGIGVVVGTALVASAGHLLTRWHQVQEKITDQYPAVERIWKLSTHDTVPIDRWLWAAAVIFAVCLIGTLFVVREPHHELENEQAAEASQQPLEITGV